MKKIIVIGIMLLLALQLKAQDWSKINELDYDAEYLYLSGQYDKALKSYLKMLKLLPESANFKYRIGLCYLNIDGEKDKAIPYLEQAAENTTEDYNAMSVKEIKAPIEALFLLGSAYRINREFEPAIRAYEKYLELITEDEHQAELTKQYIKNCKLAPQYIANPVGLKKTSIGATINTDDSNINAVISGDGNTLIFTTKTSKGFELFHSAKTDGQWEEPKKITKQISGGNSLKSSSLSHDGQVLYLIYDDPFNADIYASFFYNKKWSKAKKMKGPFKSKYNETHISVSKDENTYYFSSDRNGGKGDLDIYKVQLNEKGKWEKPENLSSINTPFNEDTPFLSSDEKYLFFSSEGHDGLGGYDIYYIDLSDPGAKPVNLGYPLNTPDNDKFYYPGEKLNKGFFSMTDESTSGKKNIYSIEILKKIKLTGKIDVAEEASLENLKLTLKNEQGQIESITISNRSYMHELLPGKYKLVAESENFMAYEEAIAIPESYAQNEFLFDIQLKPVLLADNSEQTIEVTRNDSLSLNNTMQSDSLLAIAETKEEIITAEQEGNATKEEINTEEIKKEILPAKSNSTEKQSRKKPEPYTGEVLRASNTTNTSVEVFSIQIMALKKPIELSMFNDLTDISVINHDDGFYRYYWRTSRSFVQAQQALADAHQLGYKDAFIVKRTVIPNFTIQIMALKNPVKPDRFMNLSNVTITLGSDLFYRCTFGFYENIEEAKVDLENVQLAGYKDAFVKKL